ncbi:MAG: PD-(D/E)XK nuclease family protein [Patescibacteria group bacterium]|nr:PD-(D/E)XK nuclease family protein [Patescibacteria group bacterium]MDE2015709.1 PD-(D/E)XK nuclease family protein [Patescibacteria group bacterium]MDE2226767.1 PD-(D/E)XK nuclease family protein [Patescibacteria group bacterium]
MSKYYNPQKTRNLFDPKAIQQFVVSRSGIDLFVQCQRCFYLDKRLGVARPPGYPFSLNSAVDALLKKEFDAHRAKGSTHPLMKKYGVDAIPYAHDQLDAWRDSLRRGIQYFYEPANLTIRGGVDDVWVNPQGELHIADYKATSKNGEVSLDAEWQDGYKRQMEIYQWLFRHNGFKVSNIGYFVYCNGNTDKEAFDARLEFDIKVIPYSGNDDWVEETVKNLHKCLMSDELPEKSIDCDYCAYRESAARF